MKKIKNQLLIFISMFLAILINNNFIHADDISNPSNYYRWEQNDKNTPWAKKYGSPNELCFTTAIAIQGVRNGCYKINGQLWNPLSLTTVSGGQAGLTSYPGVTSKNGKKFTFSAKKTYGQAGGDCTANPKLKSPSPSTAIVNIEKQGLFPIIHIDAGSGWTKNGGTHYMAVRQYDGHGTLSLYDPARNANYNTMKDAGGQQKLLNVVSVVFGYGGGPTPFDKAPSKQATDDNGGGSKPSGNDSSSKSSDKNNSSKKKNVPKIKPIFNPFVTPKGENSSIGYDMNTRTSAMDRGTWLTMLDNYGPKMVLWIQYAAMILMYFFIAYAVFSYLMFWVDNFLGGWLSDKLSQRMNQDSIFYKIIFPGSGNAFFGFEPGHSWAVNGAKNDIIMMAACVLVCGLVATNSLAYILGHAFYMLSKIKF